MDPARLLALVPEFAALPRLVSALGHQPGWEVIAPTFWSPGRRLAAVVRATAHIGACGSVPWIGLEVEEPARWAREAARVLGGRGHPALIAACHPGPPPAIALSVAFGDCPVLQLKPGDPVGAACLRRLAALPSGPALQAVALAAEALGGEGVGTRFFQAFRSRWRDLTDALDRRLREEDRAGLALLQLNRILFLYFVQSKGWLDGRPDFLRQQVDRCLARRRQLHRQLLRPLFFGTLNRGADQRSAGASAFGNIPFLNGGLFEPHPLERGSRGLIPNPAWRDVFDLLFEKFHFTVEEGTAGAIAPDMLGRVFEGLMAPDARGASGTFYTPPDLVTRIIDQALSEWLSTRLDPRDRMTPERAPDPSLRPLLARITILDPAVGSGAFLLGAMDRLVHWRGTPPGQEARARRAILRHNLFGVDLNPAAVRLTELRLWLSVMAAEPASPGRTIAPLPNLDCLIRQGDSLADPLAMGGRLPVRLAALAPALRKLRDTLVIANGAGKREAARQFRAAELAATRACLSEGIAHLDARIRQTLSDARAPDLFGRPRGMDRALCREIGGLRRWRATLRQGLRRLSRTGEVPWFQYQAQFADVFASAGGFDLVVGNPPWVRAEQLPPMVREQLRERYRWWRAGPGTGYRHQPDLSVAFLERATELAAPGGLVAMLLPAKLLTAGYAERARQELATRFTLRHIGEPEGAGGGFDAAVYPMMLTIRKAPPAPGARVEVESGRHRGWVRQAALAPGGPWVLTSSRLVRTLRDLERRFPPLGESCPIHLGVKTGANHVFLRPPPDVEPDLIRPALRGRDLRHLEPGPGVTLFWPCDARGRALATLPPGAARHVARHEATLRARADYRDGPPWTLFRTGPAAAPFRVTWPDLARRLTPVALTGERQPMIPLNTCYLLTTTTADAAHALAAWLSAPWLRAMARLRADPAQGGYARFNARAVAGLPLPPTVIRNPVLIRIGRPSHHPHHDPEELDECTATHLDLAGPSRTALERLARAGAGHRR